MWQVSHAGSGCVRRRQVWGFTYVKQASYNVFMAVFAVDRRVTHLLLAVLFGLLALGPFLHAHLGFSKVTGFHVAGYDGPVSTSSAHAHAIDDQAQHPDLSDAESPAVGVSASLVRDILDIPCPDGITIQSIVAIMAATLVLSGLLQSAPVWTRHPNRPRPGLPPPALAPPVSLR